ncbi:MAG: tetratricopeptide repeat protein, partial [Deltaproteobacteria bacterium]|nr:tetratricopeptide repeat protein [Deltaproteobacteria bacterium]
HVQLFEGTTDDALRTAVESAEIIPVNEMNANVPAELGAICMKALTRDPAGRYQSAKVMAAEISSVLDDAGYPDGTEAIAKWIAKEYPPGAAPAPIPVPAPIVAAASKPMNQTVMGMTPMGQPRAPASPSQPPPDVIQLDTPTMIPLDVKKQPAKPVHDTLLDPRPAFLEHKPGTVTQGWDVVEEPKPEPYKPRPKSISAPAQLPDWVKRSSGTQPPPIAEAKPPAPQIVENKPFSPSQTLQGVTSNPAILIAPPVATGGASIPPSAMVPGLKLPDAPPGATISADKPSAFATTSVVGSSISTAVPGVSLVAPGFQGNRTSVMGSNAIIEAVNASVSAANPPKSPAIAPVVQAPLVPMAPVLPTSHVASPAPAIKISEAVTLGTPAVAPIESTPQITIPRTATPDPDIRGVKWEDTPKAGTAKPSPSQGNAAGAISASSAVKLPPPADDDFAEKEASSVSHAPKRGTGKGDVLAGWGMSTDSHAALNPLGDDDSYEEDRRRTKKRLMLAMGGAIGAVVLVIVIAFAMSGGKKTDDAPVAKSTTPIGDPTQAGGGQPVPEPTKPTEPIKQAEPITPEPTTQEPEPLRAEDPHGSAKIDVPPPEPVPVPAKLEPKKPDPVKLEPKKPDPIKIAPKPPEPKKPDPIKIAPKPPEPKKPIDPPDAKPKVDSASAYKTGFQQYVKGDSLGALATFKEALASNPGYAPTWRGIGMVYEKLGRKSQAVTAFKRYLELSPNAGDAEQIRNRLERLGS